MFNSKRESKKYMRAKNQKYDCSAQDERKGRKRAGAKSANSSAHRPIGVESICSFSEMGRHHLSEIFVPVIFNFSQWD
jgi:hypothetical protein